MFQSLTRREADRRVCVSSNNTISNDEVEAAEVFRLTEACPLRTKKNLSADTT